MMLTQAEYDRLMAHWRATRTDGRPLIPLEWQVAVCDFWREQARLDAIRRARELKAEFHVPAATSLAGPPWQDIQ